MAWYSQWFKWVLITCIALSGHILQSSCIVWSSMHLIRLWLLLVLSTYAIEFPLKSAKSSINLSAYLFKFQLIRGNLYWIWYLTVDKKKHWLFLSVCHHSLVPKGVFFVCVLLVSNIQILRTQIHYQPNNMRYMRAVNFPWTLLYHTIWKWFVIWIISFCPFAPTHTHKNMINFIFIHRYVKIELQNVNLRI